MSLLQVRSFICDYRQSHSLHFSPAGLFILSSQAKLVSSAMACKRMCIRIVLITFRCERKNWILYRHDATCHLTVPIIASVVSN